MAEEQGQSGKVKVQAVLQRAIGQQVDKIAAWLHERFPEGKNIYFARYKKFDRMRFNLFFSISFYCAPKTKLFQERVGGRAIERFGLEPAEFLHLDAEDKKKTPKA